MFSICFKVNKVKHKTSLSALYFCPSQNTVKAGNKIIHYSRYIATLLGVQLPVIFFDDQGKCLRVGRGAWGIKEEGWTLS